ncbi:MAG TPA: hypothetical protein VEZ11_16310 [Thermoanaerobaculia bacterium]|nr:hypothetical protein [Thermoanaerobaculia bacterium]
MKQSAILVVLVSTCLWAGCASAPPPQDRGRGGSRPERNDAPRRVMAGGMVELLPPDYWWRDEQVTPSVAPSVEQIEALDKVAHDLGAEIDQIRSDMRLVVRDLRSVIESEKPQSTDILAAGQRVRELRNSLFDRELKMLDAERQILSRQQWMALQDALERRRAPRQQQDSTPGDRGGRRGGRGGRWPGSS